MVWVVVCVLLVMLLGVTGLLYTNTALVWVLKAIPNVHVSGVQGSIAQGFDVEALQWTRQNANGATQQVQVKQFRFAPNWPALKEHTVQVEVLSAQAVAVTWPEEANSPPPSLPDAIELPLSLEVKQLSIGTLLVNGMQVKNIQAQANVVQQQAEIKRLTWVFDDSTFQAKSSMTLKRPYVLNGQVLVQRDQDPLSLEGRLDVMGSLEQLQLTLEAKATQQHARHVGRAVVQSVRLDTVLTPFAPEALERLALRAENLNPSDWVDGAPKAKLSIQAHVQPSEQFTKASGRIQVHNAEPLSMQQGGIPLERALVNVRGRLNKQQLAGLDVEVESVRLAQGQQAAGDVQARLNWAASKDETEHSSFIQRLMNGEARVQVEVNKVKPSVFGPVPGAMVLDGQVLFNKKGHDIEVSQLQLKDREASFEGRGRGSLLKQQEVDARFEFRHVNPAAYASKASAALQGDLNGWAKVSGSLKGLNGLVDVGFENSHVAKMPFILDARVQGNPQRMSEVSIQADVLGNTLQAKGAYGKQGDSLQVQVNMPNLPELGMLVQQQLAGSVVLNAHVTGQGWGIAGQGDAKVRDLQVGQALAVKILDAQFNVGNQTDAPWVAHVEAQGIGAPASNAGDWIETLSAHLKGTRQQHTLQVEAQSDLHPFSRRRALKWELSVTGGLNASHGKNEDWAWRGQLLALKLDGMWAPLRSLALVQPASLRMAPHVVELGSFELKGEDDTRIQNRTLRIAGSDVHIQGKVAALPVPRLSTLFKTEVSIEPKDLVLGADWNYQASAKALDGQLNVFHVSGGLQVLEDLQMDVPLRAFKAKMGFTRQAATVDMNMDAKDFGVVSANMTLPIAQNTHTKAWGLAGQMPMQGSIGASFAKLNWLGPMISGGVRTQGSGQVSVAIAGSLNEPDIQGRLFGMGLEVFELDQGVRLEDGQIVVDFTTDQAKINTLDFTVRNRLSPRKHQEELLPLLRGDGKLSAQGEWNLSGVNGALSVRMDRAVIVQRPDRWVLASSDIQIQQPSEQGKPLKVRGQVDMHGAYIETPEEGAPTLGDDVVIKGKTPNTAGGGMPADVQMQAKLGPLFFLNAEGLRTRLEGGLSLVMQSASNKGTEQQRKAGRRLSATGTIQTVDGTYRAYGQDLTIEQGVINFQGPLDNPGLHVRAVRKGGAVEAGVEVTGSALRPKVTLVSDPAVPDSEKLSWMIIGRGTNASDRDQTLLLTAAAALLGNDDDGPTRKIAKRLGIDDVGLTTGSLTAADSRAVGSKVALAPGADVSANSTGADDPLLTQRIITLGKRLSDQLQVSFDQSVTTAASILKLNYQYSRQLSLIARTGADNAIDVLYQISFD